jgi:hypothetical protein
MQLIRYSRVRADFPAGMRIAGVPVGGLDRQEAAERLLQAYDTPIELHYNDAVIQVNSSLIDFQLDLDTMLAAAEQQRTQQLFWQGFWEYLWARSSSPQEIPLRFSYSEERLRAYLDELAQRYDQPPSAAKPLVGTVNFEPGQPGTELDVDESIALVENALRSLNRRQVVLPLKRSSPGRPAFQNLDVLLKQTIDLSNFDGLTSIYLLDLQSFQELHFAYELGEDIPVEPDVAFTASSIIKIPIMVSAYRRMNADEPDQEALDLLGKMIIESGNEDADWLMDRVIDSSRGPLLVTEDMQALGLDNTFLAGYFSAGSPLLKQIQTPANQRTDINLDPDLYSQTTSSDIGMLLEDIYQCSETGGGALAAVFPDEITQTECLDMIDYLAQDKLGMLIQASVPDGTRVAHKHGWVSTFGVINTIGDAGIVYTPGGNYILVIFLHQGDQLVWDPASRLIADLGRAIYNYYNVQTLSQ